MGGTTKVFVQLELDNSPADGEPMRWALGELFDRMRERSIQPSSDPLPSSELRILVTTPEKLSAQAAEHQNTTLPEGEESFTISRDGNEVRVVVNDIRGAVYALTELADRVQYDGISGFNLERELIEQPSTKIRSIARAFSSEATDKSWFYDKTAWKEYLSMLVHNRFNRFSMTLGMAYNYPYHNNMIRDVYFHFPYPYLVSVPGYDVRVVGLADEEREQNLEMLRFVGREAERRGLDFQLGLWTQRYDFEDATQAHHRIEGVTQTNLAPYCRDALVQILQACPQINGLTFRIHVEGGIEEGEYAFWQNLFQGVASVGRPIEIDLHPKGLDHAMLDVARSSGMPITVSPKYIAEHMALPYHPSAIREREYPPEVTGDVREQLSRGSRKFLRYSYGDLLSKDRDWKVLFRIWPGTQRVLLWGDPELASGYGRSSSYCGADGVELCEPQTFRGRMGTGVPGGRHNYKQEWLVSDRDWQKYEYQYRVWGRRLFSPGIGLDDCRRFLRSECGDAAEECKHGLAYASRILPLITQAHGPSVSNNLYWPEMYTNLTVLGDGLKRPYGADTDQPTRFGNVSTFDPQLFSNPREYVENILNKGTLRKYTPLDVADWLEALANQTDEQAFRMKSKTAFHTPPVYRTYVDLQILAGIGRFFAEKFRGSCCAEVFILTGINEAREQAVEHIKRGCLAWRSAVEASRDVYQDDLSFGIQHYMRGTWASRLNDIQNEISDLESWREEDGPPPLFPGEAGAPYLEALRARSTTISRTLPTDYPKTFAAGEDIPIQIEGRGEQDMLLHYRHVNQAERWNSVRMVSEGSKFCARIPSDYTRSEFHIQFYATACEGQSVVMIPGLLPNLSNEPYHTIMQM